MCGGIGACALAALACAAGPAWGADDGYAQRLVVLVNQYRTRHAQVALADDAGLSRLAHEHSVAMAKAGKMSHDGFAGRVQRSGFALCVENVGWNYPSPQAQFDGWRTSPGHERNMLDPRVDHVGVATAGSYVTLIACGR